MAWFQVSFFSECMSRSVPLNVIIPGDVSLPLPFPPNTKPYKTLYLLHGYMGNNTDWLLNTKIVEISQQRNLAVVMPSGENGFYVDQPRSGIRGSQYIGCELVEFTRKLFPLSRERDDTLIGGLSMGGYGTIYNALRYGDVFGHAIALSSPFIQYNLDEYMKNSGVGGFDMGLSPGFFTRLHGDLSKLMESDRNLEVLAKQTLDSGKPVSDFYIACGYNDTLVRGNRRFTKYLSSIGFPHVYEEGPGTHEWPFWNEFLKKGLAHVFPGEMPAMQNPFWVDLKEGE